MAQRNRLRSLTWSLTWLILVFIGCGGGGLGSCSSCSSCGGCAGGGLTPIDGGFPPAERQSEAVSIKLSQAGLATVGTEVPGLIGGLLGGGDGGTDGGFIDIAIPCTGPETLLPIGSTSGFHGEISAYICDSNSNQCASAGQPCSADIKIDGLQITSAQQTPNAPVVLAITVDLEIDTSTLPVSVVAALYNGSHQITIPGFPAACFLDCGVTFQTSGNNPPWIPITANLTLQVNPTYNEILTFDIAIPALTQAIPSNGLTIAASTDSCNLGGLFNIGCSLLNDAASTIVNVLGGTIQSEVQKEVDKFRCVACAGEADGGMSCPQNPVASSCSSGICYTDQSTDECVPILPGIEGSVSLGGLLGTYGAPASATLDLSVVAGGTQNNTAPALDAPNGGVQVGLMGGTAAPTAANCVPPTIWTPVPTPPQMNFDSEAALPGPGMDLSSYSAGVAISDPFMNKALFDVWQSGGLCLNVSGETISELTTQPIFAGVLANLNELTQNENVPMLVAIRPTQAPTILIGRGTSTDPLITVSLDEVNIEFYAFIEEHYARLFTLPTSLSVPISPDFSPTLDMTTMMPTGGTTVAIDIGTIAGTVNPNEPVDNLMNVDTDANVRNLLPSVIGLVGGLLGSAIKFNIPEIEGLELNVLGARGSGTSTGGLADGGWPLCGADAGVGCEYLALYAGISTPTEMMIARPTVHTAARIAHSFVPAKPTPIDDTTQPRVTIEASATSEGIGSANGYEYTYNIDQSPWHLWSTNSTFEVADPELRFPGNHRITVRGRIRNTPATADLSPPSVYLSVDYSPPTVSLSLDSESGNVLVHAHDDATPDSQLSYRYLIGTGTWSAPDQAHPVPLNALGTPAFLKVEVTDLAGRSAVATYGPPPVNNSRWIPPSAATGMSRLGCDAAGVSIFALAGLAAALSRRRRVLRRR